MTEAFVPTAINFEQQSAAVLFAANKSVLNQMCFGECDFSIRPPYVQVKLCDESRVASVYID